MENKVETLESQKEELASSMDESDYGTMVQFPSPAPIISRILSSGRSIGRS